MSSTPTRATIYEDTAITCMARIQSDDATNILNEDVTSFKISTFTNGTTPTTETEVTSGFSNVNIFDTLQGSVAVPDARWDRDTIGYNFRYQVPASVFITGDATYTIEFEFTCPTQPTFFVIFVVDTVEVLTS